jgi:hypothetical protein
MVLTIPFSSKRGSEDLNSLVNLFGLHSEPEMFQGFSAESAFNKSFKRSVDFPYEHWAFIQTLSDLSYGQYSFNYVLACLVSYAASRLLCTASNELEEDVTVGEFSKQYNSYIIERLKSENPMLFNALKQAIALADQLPMEVDSDD